MAESKAIIQARLTLKELQLAEFDITVAEQRKSLEKAVNRYRDALADDGDAGEADAGEDFED